MTQSDGELLELWRGGDRRSGETLFDRYYTAVERFFLNKSRDAVEDLVQETFAACVAGSHRVVKTSSFRAYLFSVAHNLLRGHLRNKYRTIGQVDLDDVSLHDLSPGQHSLLGRRRESRLLLEALRRVPITDQILLELHYWESFTTAEMADVLELPLGTVRGRLRRARDRVEQALAEVAATAGDLGDTASCLDDWAQACREDLARDPDDRNRGA